MSTHRREAKPRYGRIVTLTIAVTVSAVAALAGLGVLATAQAGPSAEPASYHHVKPSTHQSDEQSAQPDGQRADQQQSDAERPDARSTDGSVGTPQGTSTSADAATVTALPEASGHGRRIVFSQSRQRVWLVGGGSQGTAGTDADRVDRTYLVSGSVSDNLQPGTYSVYSKSRWAVGVDESGVMQYFVRFTQGPTGAAIGFHSIPTSHDVPLQKKSQLGTPQSHGCIRQDLPDAIALWDFAPIGTKVVVTA
jgi:lipoprotein-anchoring transpeptidase ErfK/SrfK